MDLNKKHINKVLLFMYILLELGPSIQSLHFGDNAHVKIIHSEVHGRIRSEEHRLNSSHSGESRMPSSA